MGDVGFEGWVLMQMPSWVSWIAVAGMVAFACVAPGRGVASVAPHDDPAHKSSLRAFLTMTDGTTRTVTLQGVGCSIGMCSRVRAKDLNANNLWLDGLASVSDVSQNTDGPVTATFKFKDGEEHQAAIVALNRVLYVKGHFGSSKKLDLAVVTKIDFE
jgi:hypothetical protein